MVPSLAVQQRRRYEHGDLITGLDGDECRAQCDLGLAEADVATDHAIHRARLGQVFHDVVDGARLVGRLVVREAGFELRVGAIFGGDRRPLYAGALRVQLGGR